MFDITLPDSVALPPGYIFGADISDDTCHIVREEDLAIAVCWLNPALEFVDGFISEPGAMSELDVQRALDMGSFAHPMPWELN